MAQNINKLSNKCQKKHSCLLTKGPIVFWWVRDEYLWYFVTIVVHLCGFHTILPSVPTNMWRKKQNSLTMMCSQQAHTQDLTWSIDTKGKCCWFIVFFFVFWGIFFKSYIYFNTHKFTTIISNFDKLCTDEFVRLMWIIFASFRNLPESVLQKSNTAFSVRAYVRVAYCKRKE